MSGLCKGACRGRFGTDTAVAEALFQAVTKANRDAKFYKGAVGLRDIKRLVAAARYVP